VIASSKIRRICLLAAAVIVAVATSHAADLREVIVEREKDYYHLDSQTYFDVSPEDMYKTLKNQDLFTKFTSAIVESKNVEPDEDGRPGFYSRMEGCVLYFCKSFVRNGHLELDPINEIVAISDPESSDFKLSRESWTFVAEGDGTLLTYKFEMVPDFWVPPVIGPYFIKRALRSGGEDAVDRIEAVALGKEPKK